MDPLVLVISILPVGVVTVTGFCEQKSTIFPEDSLVSCPLTIFFSRAIAILAGMLFYRYVRESNRGES